MRFKQLTVHSSLEILCVNTSIKPRCSFHFSVRFFASRRSYH